MYSIIYYLPKRFTLITYVTTIIRSQRGPLDAKKCHHLDSALVCMST